MLRSKGGIYFGEYLSNDDKSAVNILSSKRFCGIKFAYIFSKEVRHIHGIYFDPYTNNLWCTTGT